VRISRVIFSAAVVASAGGLFWAVTATPAAEAASSVQYVALGDSFSSGLGAGDYISSSGSCDRSTRAYPEQWADANAPASFVSVACAGATTADILSWLNSVDIFAISSSYHPNASGQEQGYGYVFTKNAG
jgi:hypothetical protein